MVVYVLMASINPSGLNVKPRPGRILLTFRIFAVVRSLRPNLHTPVHLHPVRVLLWDKSRTCEVQPVPKVKVVSRSIWDYQCAPDPRHPFIVTPLIPESQRYHLKNPPIPLDLQLIIDRRQGILKLLLFFCSHA